MPSRIIPIILSGGSGTRLWPLSRTDRPKQLIALTGDHSLLQQTALRVADPVRFAAPVVVTSVGHADEVQTQLDAVGRSPALMILEPSARNTAPAIALAALSARPDDVLLVLPSDHVVNEPGAFHAAVDAALPLARDGMLVTFGVEPDRPETGYGYIQHGEALGSGLSRVERFVEKPDLATAEAYLGEGGYLWNAGIFLMSADAYLDALDLYAPDILSAVRASLAAQRTEGDRVWPDARSFARAPSAPIDTAVIEKSDRVAVAPVSMGWSDVGSWDALHAIGDKDAAGNVLTGDIVAIDSRDCLLRSDGPVIVTIGAEELIVVATANAVLIAPRGESQRVKEAVELLQKQGR